MSTLFQATRPKHQPLAPRSLPFTYAHTAAPRQWLPQGERSDLEEHALSVSAILGLWYVAAALGLLLGVALLLVSRRAATLVTPDDPALGFMKVVLMMALRLAVVIASLFGYFLVAPEGLVAFGLAVVLSFVAGLFFEAAHLVRTRQSLS